MTEWISLPKRILKTEFDYDTFKYQLEPCIFRGILINLIKYHRDTSNDTFEDNLDEITYTLLYYLELYNDELTNLYDMYKYITKSIANIVCRTEECIKYLDTNGEHHFEYYIEIYINFYDLYHNMIHIQEQILQKITKNTIINR